MRNSKSRLITAIVGGTLAAAALAPAAQAQTAALCDTVGSGLQINGAGSTFQANAQTSFGAIVNTSPINTLPSVAPSTLLGSIQQTVAACGPLSVQYASLGSGAGRTALGANAPTTPGVRNHNYEYGGVDEPPTATQISAANLGSDQAAGGTGGAGDAALQTIPVAAGSIAVSVQLPDGCSVADINREITGDVLERALKGELDATNPDTWGDIFGANITGTSNGTACGDVEFARVVRSDSSGTTFQYKAYLAQFGTGWATLLNTAWPSTAANGGGNTLITGPGNGGVASALNATASSGGGIAYLDLATARQNHYGYGASSNDANDTRFWLWTERPANGAIVSPARDDAQNPTTPGANCSNVTFANTPASTSASWEPVTGYNTTAGYPICTLTYALAYRDMSDAGYADCAPANEATGDYLRWITNAGQATLPASDYSQLPAVFPANIVTKARAGASSIRH